MTLDPVAMRCLDAAALNDAQVVDLITAALPRMTPSSAVWAVLMQVEPDTPEPEIWERSAEIETQVEALAAISGVLNGSAERRGDVLLALADELDAVT